MRLEVAALRSGYGTTEVLRGVDLTVVEGECVALMGRNGMGKSTLLRTVLGFVPPMTGTIRIDDRPVTGKQPHEVIRQGVGYAPRKQRSSPTSPSRRTSGSR